MTITETGVIVGHNDDCWRFHPSCALAEIERLMVEVERLTKENARLFYVAQDAMKEVQRFKSGIGKSVKFLMELNGKEASEP